MWAAVLQANATPAADKLATPIEEKAKQVGDAAIPTADAVSEDLKNVAASVGKVGLSLPGILLRSRCSTRSRHQLLLPAKRLLP